MNSLKRIKWDTAFNVPLPKHFNVNFVFRLSKLYICTGICVLNSSYLYDQILHFQLMNFSKTFLRAAAQS